MPDLRSGARRSKRLDDLQQPQQPVNQVENWALPAQNKTRRRAGGGRGRVGNATCLAKDASPAIPTRPTTAGRGRRIRLLDLDPEPCDVQTPALGAPDLGFNQVEVVAEKNIAMEGGSADKAVGVEEEGSSTPVPERVLSSH